MIATEAPPTAGDMQRLTVVANPVQKFGERSRKVVALTIATDLSSLKLYGYMCGFSAQMPNPDIFGRGRTTM
jgi:hypothetical protein